jgi:hypothetical protein
MLASFALALPTHHTAMLPASGSGFFFFQNVKAAPARFSIRKV